MNLRIYFKHFLKSIPFLYNIYVRIRCGSRAEVRDWVIQTQNFLRKHDLHTFVFEPDSTYVRLDSGHEFKYVPELLGGVLGLEFRQGFEAADIRSVLKLLPKDPVVIDIGANFGIYSVLIASVSKGGHVHSFEPVSQTAELLRLNVERNGVADCVTINTAAVGDEVGDLLITSDRHAGNYLLLGGNYDGEVQKAPVVRLDDYVKEKGLERIDFIKCDVEGAELLVMRGAIQILECMRPIVMLEIAEEWTMRFRYSAADLIQYMRDLGYECRSVRDFAVELNILSSASDVTNNYLFFPRQS